MSTPWGRVQDHHRIALMALSRYQRQGMAESGYRINQDRAIAKALSAVHRDTALERGRRGRRVSASQYLELLSLIPEPLELHVTAEDIDKGRAYQSRKPSEYNYINGKKVMRYGGAIVEAVQRQTGDDCGEMICQEHLSPNPGGYRLVVLSDDANAFMKRCDAGEAVEPTTFVLEPYVVLERVPFNYPHRGR